MDKRNQSLIKRSNKKITKLPDIICLTRRYLNRPTELHLLIKKYVGS